MMWDMREKICKCEICAEGFDPGKHLSLRIQVETKNKDARQLKLTFDPPVY